MEGDKLQANSRVQASAQRNLDTDHFRLILLGPGSAPQAGFVDRLLVKQPHGVAIDRLVAGCADTGNDANGFPIACIDIGVGTVSITVILSRIHLLHLRRPVMVRHALKVRDAKGRALGVNHSGPSQLRIFVCHKMEKQK